MEAGEFNNMNEAITKFINSCQKQLASKMRCYIWVKNIIDLITKEIIINIEENIIILIIKTLLTTSDLYKDQEITETGKVSAIDVDMETT